MCACCVKVCISWLKYPLFLCFSNPIVTDAAKETFDGLAKEIEADSDAEEAEENTEETDAPAVTSQAAFANAMNKILNMNVKSTNAVS